MSNRELSQREHDFIAGRPFRLRHTNKWGEVSWFCNLGGFWGANDTRRLIERVTDKPEDSRAFDTVAEAHEVLVLSANDKSESWAIIDSQFNVINHQPAT